MPSQWLSLLELGLQRMVAGILLDSYWRELWNDTAAGVANILESEFMMSLNGIIFVSQALDFQGSTPYIRDNIIAHITYLPTMSAAAWYHNKVKPRPKNLDSFLDQSRAFATDELLPALFKGNALDDKLAFIFVTDWLISLD